MTACACDTFTSTGTTSAITVIQNGGAVAAQIQSNQTNNNAVVITSPANTASALWANCTGTGAGITGSCNSSTTGAGVQGSDNSTNGGIAISGASNKGIAVKGHCPASNTSGYAGYFDSAGTCNGVYIQCASSSAWALTVVGQAAFNNAVNVYGYLSKSGGGFLIDHPSDPENKLLNHCFAESPEMLNIYRGIATLDGFGSAVVALPDYFADANENPMPTLTAMGTGMPNLYAGEVAGNSFTIGGGQPNGKVSWTMTGARADKWAKTNHPGVSVAKKVPGTFVHPELFGAEKSKSICHFVSPDAELVAQLLPASN